MSLGEKNDLKMIFMMRKKTPLFLIGKHLGKNFTFHNNIDINNDIPSKFLSFLSR